MWRDILRSEGVAGLQIIRNVRGSRYRQIALEQREALKDYFMNENILSWQLEHVQSCGPVLKVWNWKQTIIYRTNRFSSETCSYIINVIHDKSCYKKLSIEIYQIKPVHCPIVPVQGD